MLRHSCFNVGALTFGAILLLVAAAQARLCGDDVAGNDVPCGCGDIVVSNLTITDDPVAAKVCAGDGLIIRAARGAAALTVDLAGARLRGSGRGVGIRVMDGGLGGLRLMSTTAPATIQGFRDGLTARGGRVLAAASDVTVIDSARDGVRLEADGGSLAGIVSRRSGRDGIHIRGRHWSVASARSDQSGRHGLALYGSAHHVLGGAEGSEVVGSGRAGLIVWGFGHRIAGCSVKGAVGDGIRVHGLEIAIEDCEARANGGIGLAGAASRSRFGDNLAVDNGGGGIVLEGLSLQDAGGNIGEYNGWAVAPGRAEDCRFGRWECRR